MTARERGSPVLFVTEGSGGHLVPALEAARLVRASGVPVTVWYARRGRSASLTDVLVARASADGLACEPVAIPSGSGTLRWLAAARLWGSARRWIRAHRPAAVVGFGGGVCVPVILAARGRARTIIHEQNVVMGRANRWLAGRADVVAVSFPGTQGVPHGVEPVVTGMPVRAWPAPDPAARPAAQTFALVVLGGSQGSRAVNRIVCGMLPELSKEERARWTLRHLTGTDDVRAVEAAYRQAGVAGRIEPFRDDMASVYAGATLAIARAGAATVAELAQTGTPAILIPYPHAGAHQVANARWVEAAGGGIVLEESPDVSARLADLIRTLARDRLRLEGMAARMRGLARSDAAERLARIIVGEADADLQAPPRRAPDPVIVHA
ncbi:MAG TPA: UDP-N-acetylglucosamine--N-acetylmuramyl-(pentapeptide) pyrophosphoryl-undecaprenol N-acetylglucosamine transferase [bacterium]